MVYVGRAEHEGDMLVCKVVPAKQIGFVSSRGEAIPKDTFEVLCGQHMTWLKCYDHVIPENAVLCGRTKLEQPVYIGRGHYEGFLIPGKVSSVHRALFIPFRGAERRLESYEVLVDEGRPLGAGWMLPPIKPEVCPLTPSSPPPPPPPPAFSVMPEKVYPTVAPTQTYMPPPPPSFSVVPEKVYPTAAPSQTYVPPPPPPPYPMDEPPKYSPTPMPTPYPMPMPMPVVTPPFIPAETVKSTSVIPADTYQPGYSPAPAPPPTSYTPAATYAPTPSPPPPTHAAAVYVPSSRDVWVSASPGYVPPNAVTAGHDIDMQTQFVCRAYHNGHLVPGKALSSRGVAMISDAGYEIQKSNYEVLIGNEHYHWTPAYSGSVAPGAVEGGRSPSGEPYFIGRAHYGGSLTCGKIQASHGCLYIPFGGSERRITNYEVLVRKDHFYRQEAIKMAY